MKTNSNNWRWFFALAALEAGAALLVLFLVPHEGSSFSLTRLAMFAVLFAFCVLWIYFFIRPPKFLDFFIRSSVALLSALLAVTLGWLLFFLRYLDPERLLPYYERLSPILFYILFLALQLSVFVLISVYGFHRKNLSEIESTCKTVAIAFGGLILVLCFVAVTHLGFIKDPAYWGEPGVPLLSWQMILVMLIGLTIMLVGLRFALDKAKGSAWQTDLIFAVVIWLAAILIWHTVPISAMQNSFYAPVTPPTNQPFPNSDASYYDYHAQSILLGTGYLGDIPTRPLYILLLAFLHILFGQNYFLIMFGQSCVLALFPVTLYFLGKKIHSRTAGMMVAFFAIFRELTTLLVSSATRVSDTRTLLTDLPTVLMVTVACLFVMRWLESKNKQCALVAGGIFGVMLLLRTQSIIILPLVLLSAVIVFWPNWLNAGKMIVLFAIGITVTIAPWLIHNYLVTGKFAFDDPRQMAVISSQYALTGNLDITQFNIQSQSLAGNLIAFTLKYPDVVAQFVTNHFLATEINGLLALPLVEPFKSLRAPIDIYWFAWDGRLNWYNFLLIIVYLAIIAVGLGTAWKRLRWLGLVPLIFSLGYALSNGIARFSGWRYDLPADWISYFYFGLGAAEVFSMLALLFGASAQRLFTPIEVKQNNFELKFKYALPVVVCFLLVGAAPWIAEHAVSPRILPLSDAEMIQQVSDVHSAIFSKDELNQFLAKDKNPNAEAVQGRLLYPRFFWRGQGIIQAHPSPAYQVRDYARLGFFLMTDQIEPWVFPSKTVPSDFPATGNVIVFGCKQTDYVEARIIVFPEQNLIFQADSPFSPCSNN